MTEAPKRSRRFSKGTLRALSWIAGGAAFAAPFASLTASPKPATAASADPGQRVIIVKKITRRVVVHHPAPDTPAVQYVYVGSDSSGSSGSSSGSSNSGAVAAGPPATSTGGS